MKFLVFKFLTIFLYLISTSLSYSIEQPNIKNIVVNKVPKTIENVVFKDINNEEVALDDYIGQLIILNFWATWCAPCREEMPSLDLLMLDQRFKNLNIFPINIGQENLDKSKSFFKELNIKSLKIYNDPTVNMAKKFSLRGIPTTILINKKGKEFARVVGSIDFNDKEFIEWLENFD